MNKYLFIAVLILLSIHSIYSQSIIRSGISALGSSHQEDNLIIRQTVGQPALVQMEVFENLVLRQGFQQPVNMKMNHESGPNILSQVALFPNPNPGWFTLHIKEISPIPFHYHIYNTLGLLVKSGWIQGGEQSTIRCMDYPPGIYLLHLKHTDYLQETLRFIIQ